MALPIIGKQLLGAQVLYTVGRCRIKTQELHFHNLHGYGWKRRLTITMKRLCTVRKMEYRYIRQEKKKSSSLCGMFDIFLVP
jgi:hypothetical protein